ncbi:zinc finger CCCH domain-containing protein 56-like [Salvia miltiorrhiza]|uniref:zinc finger CCCH domain-containing protein 56-like n=1 Tax=Salvia miltiorrhiza TaxID=226208 RepID=UPI0025AD25DB|nr:zinc finger CCCH domain-containing protein 56-like [Salvia miltiorrhiza]XP_057780513.1 zinc finger CCCH domain-containing protein 56-like [Salvia miltiorrhiza]XP_057780514.1 zinc finger CCCH domain-containing protein 56-like [Salvia miltiorrhiza]XP_057780515.1 zinc finger CCCH domain-containing protein 56-like [Salvia miltiorrhiza]XP_057780516.1 zinc finger CCCH domain-containing protein 56-like [Salvia miltiorrhiza]
MECNRGTGSHVANVVGFQSGNPGNSAKDGMCERETSVHTNLTSNCNERSFQFEVESEPPNKRAKNDLLEDSTTFDRKKTIGKVLYKTRLCFQFRAGSCPFDENCDFAHSMEELRELPHNWQEILATHKEELMELSEQSRDVFQIPAEETHRPSLRQYCKGFLSRVGCQYGENCLLIHNEHYMERKSAAICLIPGPGSGFGSNGSKLTSNASHWKSRLCNKWESTGICEYGRNCVFAHGFAELQHYGGWRVKEEDIGSSAFGANQVAVPAKASVGAVGAPASLVPYSYRIGAPSRRLPAEIPIRRWKGPDKISKIYGDWIDDLE